MTTESDVSAGKVALVEVEALKREQLARIGTRDNQVYATLAAVGLAAAAIQRGGSTALLLAVPPVVLVLGQTRLANDVKVAAIGRYLREVAGPRLEQLTGESALVWERFQRVGSRRRAVSHLLADLLLFVVGPLAALVYFWTSTPSVALLLVSVAELVLVALFTAELLRCSGVLLEKDGMSGPQAERVL
jgi:hypothetical protein